MRAMLFCAGLGRRLLPITVSVPKPMVDFFGRPLVDYTIEALATWGVRELIVNLHHLPEMIRRHLLSCWGKRLAVRFSEEERPLGTGGGLKRVEGLLYQGTFLACNSDILIDPDLDLAKMLEFHRAKRAAATLLVKRADSRRFTPIEIDSQSRIARLGSLYGEESGTRPKYVFCGLQILEPVVFRFLPQGQASSLTEAGYAPMLKAGLGVFGYVHEGYWEELGQIDGYLRAHYDVLARRSPFAEAVRAGGKYLFVSEAVRAKQLAGHGIAVGQGARLVGPLALGRGCRILDDAQVGPLVSVGQKARVGKGCMVERSVIWAQTRVGSGVRLSRAVIYC